MEVVLVDKEKFAHEIIELSMYAFQYELSGQELEDKIREMKQQKVLGVFKNSKLVAKTQIRDLKIQQGNKEIKMGGIQSVATYPEYRRNGYVKQLLLRALEEMKEDGYMVSFLFPFAIDFYRKFGYEILSDSKKVIMNQQDLIPLQNNGKGNVVRLKKNEYHVDLSIVYTLFSKQYSGMLCRSDAWWKTYSIKDLIPAIYYNDLQQPQGYILYELANRQMIVREFLALNNDARIGLWNFISQHDSMVQKLELYLTEHDPLTYLLKNPGQEIHRIPYFMLRIVNVEEYLKQFPFEKKDQFQVIMKVKDECAPWNNGYYKLSHHGVEKHSTYDNQNVLELSINSLSSLMIGYKTVQELYEINEITGNHTMIETLASIIPKQKTYFADTY